MIDAPGCQLSACSAATRVTVSFTSGAGISSESGTTVYVLSRTRASARRDADVSWWLREPRYRGIVIVSAGMRSFAGDMIAAFAVASL